MYLNISQMHVSFKTTEKNSSVRFYRVRDPLVFLWHTFSCQFAAQENRFQTDFWVFPEQARFTSLHWQNFYIVKKKKVPKSTSSKTRHPFPLLSCSLLYEKVFFQYHICSNHSSIVSLSEVIFLSGSVYLYGLLIWLQQVIIFLVLLKCSFFRLLYVSIKAIYKKKCKKGHIRDNENRIWNNILWVPQICTFIVKASLKIMNSKDLERKQKWKRTFCTEWWHTKQELYSQKLDIQKLVCV